MKFLGETTALIVFIAAILLAMRLGAVIDGNATQRADQIRAGVLHGN